jgi:hypothetical protein
MVAVVLLAGVEPTRAAIAEPIVQNKNTKADVFYEDFESYTVGTVLTGWDTTIVHGFSDTGIAAYKPGALASNSNYIGGNGWIGFRSPGFVMVNNALIRMAVYLGSGGLGGGTIFYYKGWGDISLQDSIMGFSVDATYHVSVFDPGQLNSGGTWDRNPGWIASSTLTAALQQQTWQVWQIDSDLVTGYLSGNDSVTYRIGNASETISFNSDINSAYGGRISLGTAAGGGAYYDAIPTVPPSIRGTVISIR